MKTHFMVLDRSGFRHAATTEQPPPRTSEAIVLPSGNRQPFWAEYLVKEVIHQPTVPRTFVILVARGKNDTEATRRVEALHAALPKGQQL